MPDLDDPGAARRNSARNHGAVTSRRSVLQVAAGAGAAGIAATTLGSVLGGVAARAGTGHDAHPERTAADTADATEPIVLHVRDAAAGEIDVFRGTAQTQLHDRDLAARIVRASR
jgi:hypothetical protein